MAPAFLLTVMLAAGGGLVRSGSARPGPPQSVAMNLPAAFATLGSITASPGTISFSATDPSLGSVIGSSPATISWPLSGGSNANTWTLNVQASGSSFNNCSTVPVSAVTVSCTSATVSGGGGTGACGGSFPLSPTPQQVAGGIEGSSSQNYSVTLNFSLAESWRYVATLSPPCTITLTYTVNAP